MKNTHKRKAECTPEEWAAHLEYHRLRRLNRLEEERARLREYNARPEVKARRKAHDAKPEIAAKRRAHAQTEAAKEREKKRHKEVRANPEKWGDRIAQQRKRRTGFAKEEISALLILQNNRCAVCDRCFDGRQIRADHCHDTNTPRGLLCHHCNIIEGMLRSMKLTPEGFAKRLAAYLTHPPILSLQNR